MLVSGMSFLSPQQNHTLEVTLTGVQSSEGEVVVGLYQNEDQWTDDPFRSVKVKKGEGGTCVAVFQDLPAGTYAVSVLDDTNANNRMDTNLFGWPQEGFAFSNNVKPTILGAPGYTACAFEVQGKTACTLRILYY